MLPFSTYMATLPFLFCLTLIIHPFLQLPGRADQSHGFHTIHTDSFFQDGSVCKPSTGSRKAPSSIEVVHRYGPCSPLNQDRTTATPSLSDILSSDQSRVRSIQAHLARDSDDNEFMGIKVNLPVQSGSSHTGNYIVSTLGTSYYIVSIGLGTPKKTLSLAFDTGSELTWIQCQPCAGSCHQQLDPIFDPSSSISYSNVSCNSRECSQLASATGQSSTCVGATCTYRMTYGDVSHSTGFFSKDTVTLSPTDVFPNFLFGCGQDTSGLLGRSDGILGLGRDGDVSIISQTARKYGKYFSYCLPSSESSNGHLTLGKTAASTHGVKFTPLDNSRGTSFYFIDIVGISVGGHQLSINPTIFKTSGNIIDSTTVITRLPRTVYNAMRQAFRQEMKGYPREPGLSDILDTCYDLSNFTSISVPKIVFTFAGNVSVDLDSSGILVVYSWRQVCLAFIGNEDDSTMGIFGSTQQKTLEVVYDVAGGKIGFGEGGCEGSTEPTDNGSFTPTTDDHDMCLQGMMYLV